MEQRSRRTRTRKKKRLKTPGWIVGLLVCFIIGGFFLNQFLTKSAQVVSEVVDNEERTEPSEVDEKQVPEKVETEVMITISAAGDFTLGTDESFTYAGSFPDEASKKGMPHFVAKLDSIFEKDDFTTVNLETTLTNATVKAQKKFRFKGDPAYAEILKLGGIEAVNLANNHTQDYLKKGYEDTIATLKQNGIGHFGYDQKYMTEVKGVKIGALGYEGWNDTPEIRATVEKDINDLREQGATIVLVHYHWGNEREYVPYAAQRTLAQYTIESGADLILGHHPHVIQGIEEYKGKFIVYSLGNFMFGGNRNPSDKDTYVFQQTFQVKGNQVTDHKQIKVIPFSISSVQNRNNYQPLLLTGSEKDRVKQKIVDASNQIDGSDWLQYETE